MAFNQEEVSSMKKLIEFTPDLNDKSQAYANAKFNGNFSIAVRFLCVTGVSKEKSKTS